MCVPLLCSFLFVYGLGTPASTVVKTWIQGSDVNPFKMAKAELDGMYVCVWI